MRRVAGMVALVMLAGSASAQSLAERLRSRMQPKWQQLCAAKLKAAKVKGGYPGSGSRMNLELYFPFDEGEEVAACQGASEVDELLRQPPSHTAYKGDEPPVLEIKTEGGKDPRYPVQTCRMVFGARIQGRTYPVGLTPVGLYAKTYRNSIGVEETDGVLGIMSQFGQGVPYLPKGFHDLNPDNKGSHPDELVRTGAPWVKTRLDDDSLYFGQFQDGQPHGWGFQFFDGRWAGRLGSFRAGKPHGFLVEWRTRRTEMYPVRGFERDAVPATLDYVKRSRYEDGVEKAMEWVMRGVRDWAVKGEGPCSASNAPPDERAAEAAARAYQAQKKAFEALRAGDLIAVTGDFLLVAEDGRKDARMLLGNGPTMTHHIYLNSRISFLDQTKAYDVPGYGRVEGTPEARAALGSKWAADRAAAQKAADELWAKRMSYNPGGTVGGGSPPSPSSSSYGGSYSSPSSSSSGPRIGTQAWWNERAASDPSLIPLAGW